MEQASDGIRIVVLNGSVRPGNYTRMASALVVDELKKDPRVSVDVIDPEGLALPPPGTGLDSAATKSLQSRVLRAAGVVLATPEYHGSFSSVMKLMIENLGFPSVLAGKTVALLGVAAGSIGRSSRSSTCEELCPTWGASLCPSPSPWQTCSGYSTTKAIAWIPRSRKWFAELPGT